MRERDADHRVARNERGELVLGQLLGPCRAARDDEVADVGGRVDDAHLDLVWKLDAELAEHAAWVGDRPRAVRAGSCTSPGGGPSRAFG